MDMLSIDEVQYTMGLWSYMDYKLNWRLYVCVCVGGWVGVEGVGVLVMPLQTFCAISFWKVYLDTTAH